MLEIYLAYLVSNGGHRFTTQVCANRHGEWVSNQLEGFLLAVRCFIDLTGMIDFLPVRGGPRSGWGPAYGFPRMPLCSVRIIYPYREKVDALLHQSADHIANLTGHGLPKRAALWRRWDPGLANSQMSNGGDLPSYSPLQGPKRRITCKSSPPSWDVQLPIFRAFITRRQSHSCTLQLWPGTQITLGHYLGSMGVCSDEEIKSLAMEFHAAASRAAKLISHAQKREGHLPVDIYATRQVCVLCLDSGPSPFCAKWMASTCPAPILSQPEDTLSQLSKDRTIAQQRAALLHKTASA